MKQSSTSSCSTCWFSSGSVGTC